MQELKRVSVRLVDDPPLLSEERIDSPEAAVRLLGGIMQQLDREVVVVINLKSDMTPINCNFISQGAINKSIAEPSNIMKSAILSNAAGMIMIHNHPSGRLNPSLDDTFITKRMEEICNIMGIKLVDHIIVGPDNERYFSFKKEEMLPLNQVEMGKLSDKVTETVILQENTVTGLINKYIKLPDSGDRLKTGYKMLECVIEEMDNILKTDVCEKLREKAKEGGLIKTDINILKKELLNQRKGR
jgi:DNA repair protein RadC